jgi:hypothetical protein
VLCFASSGLLFASTLPCFALPDLASPSIAIPPHRYSPPCLFYAYPIRSLPFHLTSLLRISWPFHSLALPRLAFPSHGISILRRCVSWLILRISAQRISIALLCHSMP